MTLINVTGTVRHLLAASAPGRVAELVALGVQIQAPLPLSTRIGVVSTSSGIGCSVVAGLIATALAARRPGRVLAVNASIGGRSLLWHAGCTDPATATPEAHAERLNAQNGAEAIAGLVRTPAGLYCLDLAQDAGPVPDSSWWAGVGAASRFFDVIVTDSGARSAQQCGPVGAASSVACIVTEAERSAWQHGIGLAASFVQAGVPAVLAVSAARGPAPAWASIAAGRSAVPVVVVPHDRAHGSAWPPSGHELRAATTQAVLRLAAALVTAAGPSKGVRS